MKNSKTSSQKLSKTAKWVAIIFLLASLVGFVDASYLTVEHYSGDGVVCSLVHGCDEVLTSKYATVAATNIPTALAGVGYYLVIFILSVAYLDRKNELFLKSASYLTALGFLVSLGLLYIQAFILEAFCQYCLISIATSTILFIAGLYYILNNRRDPEMG